MKTLPQILYSTDTITADKPKVNSINLNEKSTFIYLKNSIHVKAELKSELKRQFAFFPIKKLTKLLHVQIKKSYKLSKANTGLLTCYNKQGQPFLMYYVIKLKGKFKSKIELFLTNLTQHFDLGALLKTAFEKELKHFRKSILKFINRYELTYLKSIGKGKIDYDIEKILNINQVEMQSLKENLRLKLKLRNTNELFWISQRMGFVE